MSFLNVATTLPPGLIKPPTDTPDVFLKGFLRMFFFTEHNFSGPPQYYQYVVYVLSAPTFQQTQLYATARKIIERCSLSDPWILSIFPYVEGHEQYTSALAHFVSQLDNGKPIAAHIKRLSTQSLQVDSF